MEKIGELHGMEKLKKLEETPQVHKKIRNCCVYKYPDWVQGLAKPQHHHHSPQPQRPPQTATSMRDGDLHSTQPQPGPSSGNQSNYSHAGGQMDGHRPPTTLAQKGRSSSQGGGPNVLLKQAIANRIGKDETMNHDAQVQQLDRSLLTHPAWSRDQDGRTGYSPRYDAREKDFVKQKESGKIKIQDLAKKAGKVTIKVTSSREKLEDIDLKGARKLSPRRSVLTRENSEPSLSLSSKTETTIRAIPIKQDDRLLKTEKLKKPKNIGERRESSVSDSSRISIQSGKSVKFSDRIQITEIERHERESSSEEDAAVMSDDEMGKERRKNEKDISRESLDFEELERKILEEQKELESLGKKKKPPMPMYRISGVETDSLASFYPEDVQPDRFLIGEDEYEYVSLEQLPDTVREAVIRDMNEGNFYEEMGSHDEGSGINLGSMSRLHEVPESNDEMPRSASGYFDESGLHDSYQQAMQNSQKQKPSENLFQSFYENVQGGYVGTSSQDRYPSPGMINSNILNEIRADPTYPTSPIRELSLKEQRQAFFRSMLPNERSTSGPTSPTSPEETEMRKQFVQRYGRRKAPIAEGDPADPRPSLGASQDSVVSLGSHESVVSAASIRAERAVRRDFNY